MEKTLELDLGQINAMVIGDSPNPVVATGWYVDPDTGQYYYYDAPTSQWYVYSAGLLYPLGLPSWQNSPSPKVDLQAGGTAFDDGAGVVILVCGVEGQ